MPNNNQSQAPSIIIENDHNGYFEGLVREWCKAKTTPWKTDTIVVNLRGEINHNNSYHPVALWNDLNSPKTLHIDFYSKLNHWCLTTADAQGIIDHWL